MFHLYTVLTTQLPPCYISNDTLHKQPNLRTGLMDTVKLHYKILRNRFNGHNIVLVRLLRI